VNVLVTGATTPLGVAIVEELLADSRVGHVLAVGLERDAVPAGCSRARFTYEAIDLTRSRAVHDLLFGTARMLGIDTVIHGAQHRSAREAGGAVHAINVEATRQLVLEAARHPTIRRFVHRSAGAVYAIRATEPNLIDEDVPLELDPSAPQWVRDRVEADLTVCAHVGRGTLSIAVLRCAEVLAEGAGSQLWDYLRSRICFRPLGFDPMINLLSTEDYARAIVLAASSRATGVFNIHGTDTLPLSKVIRLAGRRDVAIPGPLLSPAYWLRTHALGLEFRYDLNMRRFHFGGMLDGGRAERELGYRPIRSLWPAICTAGAGLN
jgi:UDP-glucose 4-epimerase